MGVYASWSDAGVKGNDLSLNAQGWPDDALVTTLKEQIAIGEDRTLRLRASELRRSDELFYGVGPSTLESDRSRYFLQRAYGDVSYEWRFWRSSRVETTVGVRDASVEDGHFEDDPSLRREAATGAFAVPYGYGREYTAEYNRIVAAIDSRIPERHRGSGLRLELDAEQANDLRNTPASGWIRYGATAAGYLDLTGHRRVLGLSVMAELVDPLGARPVPFTELVSLGGDYGMTGFYPGRLLGESAAVTTLSYSWPLALRVDGTLQGSVGNTFGDHFAGFDAGLLRFSAAFGLQIGGLQNKAVMGTQDAPLQVVLGIGSETFDHGGQIDSVRLMAGVPAAFRGMRKMNLAKLSVALVGARGLRHSRATVPARRAVHADTDLNPVWVACHPAPGENGSAHTSCAPKASYNPFIWDALDNVLFRPVDEGVTFVDGTGESTDVNSLDEVPDSCVVHKPHRGAPHDRS